MKPRLSHAYVLSVTAEDRPGIVAAVSKTVQDAGGNIDACSQTVVAGYFALMMIISFERPIEPPAFEQALMSHHGLRTHVHAHVRPYQPIEAPELSGAENFVVTCFGPDVPGVIYRFAALLADKGINIVDLYGQLNEGQFVLISQVQIPARWDIAMLQADLEALGRDQGYTVRLQHENIFIATNQLRLGRVDTRKA